ncbi:hypothetical protein GGF41_006983, partial [Coemansia sp. RSA 2531]
MDNLSKVPAERKASGDSSATDHSGLRGSSDGTEPVMSFGEPLHVSVSRGTERFKSIQRTYSKPLTIGEEEEAAAIPEGGFDLTTWLTGRQQKQGPPFAKRIGLVFDDVNVFGDNVSNRHIATVVTPFYKLGKAAMHGFGIGRLFGGKADKHRQLLHNVSGVVEDGE